MRWEAFQEVPERGETIAITTLKDSFLSSAHQDRKSVLSQTVHVHNLRPEDHPEHPGDHPGLQQ